MSNPAPEAGEKLKPAYQVEKNPGCQSCGEGATWDVIGPDGIAQGITFRSEIDAEEYAVALIGAYELGRAHDPYAERRATMSNPASEAGEKRKLTREIKQIITEGVDSANSLSSIADCVFEAVQGYDPHADLRTAMMKAWKEKLDAVESYPKGGDPKSQSDAYRRIGNTANKWSDAARAYCAAVAGGEG